MKIIILAGGLGTRISEETADKPKPMVLLDDKPILWHLMNIFAVQGFNDFVIATGYKKEIIQDWVKSIEDKWNVVCLDTGLNSQTGGRIAQCMNCYPGETFLATYGDGLANINLKNLIDFHKRHGRLSTVTAVRPPARFGVLESDNGLVTHFGEKNQADAGWINGGFFVLEPGVANYIQSILEPFESGALPRLVKAEELMSYHHSGFWKPMDTLREKVELQELSQQSPPPWLQGI